MLTQKGDVLVIGGSLEGALIARALHRSGQKVLLLDKGRPRDPETPYDRWICSPFLYSAAQWQWIRDSQAFWEEQGCLSFHDGAAVAPRESPSWERLVELQESHCVKGPALDPGLFREFKLSGELGSVYMEKLPSLDVSGLTELVWRELQREGVDPCADTEVRQIDWEHEWPTAVSRDTIFRARRLILTAPSLFHQEKHSIRQFWMQGQPELEDRRPLSRPALWIHYAKAPVYLWPGASSWGWTRLHEAEPNEETFLRGIPERWLRCAVNDAATYELRVDQAAMGHHPWRKDCLWLSKQGQQNWPWLPQLVESLKDPTSESLLLQPERRPEVAGPLPL